MAGAGDRVVAGDEVDLDVDRGGQGLVGLLAEQELVGRRHQLGRRERADETAQGAGELQRLRAHRRALAAHVDQRHLQPAPVAQVGDEEVAGIAGAVGGDGRRLRAPAVGERRHDALALEPVAQLAQHGLAQRHRQPGALLARLVEGEQHADGEDDERGLPAGRLEAALDRGPPGDGDQDDPEHQQRHEPQQHRAEHEEEEPQGDGHDAFGQGADPERRGRRGRAAPRAGTPGCRGIPCASRRRAGGHRWRTRAPGSPTRSTPLQGRARPVAPADEPRNPREPR